MRGQPPDKIWPPLPTLPPPSQGAKKPALKRASLLLKMGAFFAGGLSSFFVNLCFGILIVDILGFRVDDVIIGVNCLSLAATSLISLVLFFKMRSVGLIYFFSSFFTGIFAVAVFTFAPHI